MPASLTDARLKASSASARLIKTLEKTHTILTSTGEVEKVAQKFMLDQFQKTGQLPKQPEVMKMVLKYFDNEEIRPKRGVREASAFGLNEDTKGWDPELLKLARQYDREQVNMGIKVEKEHDQDPATDVVKDKNDLLKIALAHLAEDPEYYTKLADMEADFDGEEAYAPSEYPQSRDPYRVGGFTPNTHISRNGLAPRPMDDDEIERVPLGRERPRLKENHFGRNQERVMRAAGLLTESMSRYCHFYKDKKGDWWLELADREYGEHHDAYTYGPFSSEDEADNYLHRNFSNPGGMSVDRSGTKPTPKKSPNGRPIQEPRSSRGW